MKFALDEGRAQGADIILGGLEIDEVTLEALRADPYGLNPFSAIINSIRGTDTLLWRSEFKDLYATLDTLGGSAFAESFDKFRAAWTVKCFEKFAPH